MTLVYYLNIPSYGMFEILVKFLQTEKKRGWVFQSLVLVMPTFQEYPRVPSHRFTDSTTFILSSVYLNCGHVQACEFFHILDNQQSRVSLGPKRALRTLATTKPDEKSRQEGVPSALTHWAAQEKAEKYIHSLPLTFSLPNQIHCQLWHTISLCQHCNRRLG